MVSSCTSVCQFAGFKSVTAEQILTSVVLESAIKYLAGI